MYQSAGPPQGLDESGPGTRHEPEGRRLFPPPHTQRGFEGGPGGPRTWVSPFPAAQQGTRSRLLGGRPQYNHYVEFNLAPGESLPVGGIKGVAGLGRYQRFSPGRVGLEGRQPVFGELPPVPGLRYYVPGAILGIGAGLYAAYKAFYDD